MFQGTYTALVTPFRAGRIDEEAFARLIEDQIAGGIRGVVPVGTTGESPTLSAEEHLRVIELAVEIVAGRIQVVAGTGSNCTAEAVEYSRLGEQKGADGLLLVNPYYNKPSQEGLFRHYQTIAAAVQIPIMLYSVPGRTGGEIGVETAVRLAAAAPNIVAIKEASGSADRASQLRAALPGRFAVLSGDDASTLPFIAVGAAGVVSVASNLIPREVAAMVDFALAGEMEQARQLHHRFLPLFKDIFIEANPVPAKTILGWQGKISPEVRLPLCEMSEANTARLRQTASSLGLL